MGTEESMMEKLPEYFAGGLSEAEKAGVERWISESAENAEAAESVARLLAASDVVAFRRKSDAGVALSRMDAGIAAGRRRRILFAVQKAAAVACIPLAAFSIWSAVRFAGARPEEVPVVEVRATSGMTAGITLPDSSRVWLNSGSVLRYPSRFSDTRDVELCGEAYFKVAKDPARKFHVKTGEMTVEVVGTEFNVDAYGYAGRPSKTTLVNGAINMHYLDASENPRVLKIYPGQCATMSDGEVTLASADPAVASSWRYGKIYLNHTPAADALRMVENRYNVRFDVKNERIYARRFTGQFVDQRLDVVLEHFSRSAGMKFIRKRTADGNVSGREVIELW